MSNCDFFAVVPCSVIMARDLTLQEMRVLVALLSFRGKNSDVVWPSRAVLGERCGYSEKRVSEITTQLCAKGWITKEGNGGRSMSCRYRFTPKVRTTEHGTVYETVPDHAQERSHDLGGAKNLPGTEKIELKDARAREPIFVAEGSSNAEPAAKPASIPDMPLPDCISREAWRDWCEYRAKGKERAKWTTLAATKAIALLARADAAGHDTTAIMERSIVGGWSGLFPDRETRKPGIVEARRPGPTGNTVRGNYDEPRAAWQRARDRKHELDEFMSRYERGEIDLDGTPIGKSDTQAHDGEFRVSVA